MVVSSGVVSSGASGGVVWAFPCPIVAVAGNALATPFDSAHRAIRVMASDIIAKVIFALPSPNCSLNAHIPKSTPAIGCTTVLAGSDLASGPDLYACWSNTVPKVPIMIAA